MLNSVFIVSITLNLKYKTQSPTHRLNTCFVLSSSWSAVCYTNKILTKKHACVEEMWVQIEDVAVMLTDWTPYFMVANS